jgi:predicted  nucleic acid-binding Zn-ribbon protein
MEVFGLLWVFGLYASVESQLTMVEIQTIVHNLVEERLKGYSGERENRLLQEEVASLQRSQSRLEADLKNMQIKIEKLSDENENSKQKIEELHEENLELKKLVRDKVESNTGTKHFNESVVPSRDRSGRSFRHLEFCVD